MLTQSLATPSAKKSRVYYVLQPFDIFKKYYCPIPKSKLYKIVSLYFVIHVMSIFIAHNTYAFN